MDGYRSKLLNAMPSVPHCSVLDLQLFNCSSNRYSPFWRITWTVNEVLGVPQGSVLGSELFVLYTAWRFFILENKLYVYADYSTLDAVPPYLMVRKWEL